MQFGAVATQRWCTFCFHLYCLMQGDITSWKVWRVSEFKVGEYGHGGSQGNRVKHFQVKEKASARMSYKTGLSWRHRIGAGELGHWLLVMLVCSSAGGIFQYSKKVGQTLSRHTSVSATKAISICLQGSLLCPAASASAALLSLTNK